MSKKGLSQFSSKPQLAVHYERAHKLISDKYTIVPKKYYNAFTIMQKDFEDIGIDMISYSRFAVTYRKSWLKKKRMNRVPVTMFLGSYLIEKYLELCISENVKVMDDSEDKKLIILYNELLFARTYIQVNIAEDVSEKKVINMISDMLSEEWKSAYFKGKNRPIIDVMKIICREYSLGDVATYDDVVEKLINNG